MAQTQILQPQSKEEIDKAVKIINENFIWGQTPQGNTYWENVVKNIQKVKEMKP